jgi:hypothetical protein
MQQLTISNAKISALLLGEWSLLEGKLGKEEEDIFC